MIRHTHRANPGQVLSAYRDNAAVIAGGPRSPAACGPRDYGYTASARDHGMF
jgi:hypothetical protein